MTLLTRTVDSGVVAREEKQVTQAAINSDGCITIREYNVSNPANEREIMLILSRNETSAVFDLMKEINRLANTDLPF